MRCITEERNNICFTGETSFELFDQETVLEKGHPKPKQRVVAFKQLIVIIDVMCSNGAEKVMKK